VENVYSQFMHICDCFCYKPILVGVGDSVATLEKDTWAALFPMKPQVSSDVILDFLLNRSAEEVFGGIRGIQDKTKK